MKNASAIGQAINLAAADARKHDEESNPKYIWRRYLFWEVICGAIQSSDSDVIQEVIDDPNFNDCIENLRKYFDRKDK